MHYFLHFEGAKKFHLQRNAGGELELFHELKVTLNCAEDA